jgi:hypothetical protein
MLHSKEFRTLVQAAALPENLMPTIPDICCNVAA